eukprot:TRINITY_DN37598_c0_g1_i1.p1 TRINITY_DN37598_c0_g1~~TRINITY_DN37598_c0_g1_i1.p1  ORF type:complete len:470 (+),score=197.61 TRINITY_DN37598_c0_g1_i1:58-1467(+)
MGAPEHDDRTHPTIVDDPKGELDKSREVDNDDDNTGEQVIVIEKTKEQLREEAIRRWMMFHYPAPTVVFVWALFAITIINQVMTLDQWHGTHMWRKPFDLYPSNNIPGGWEDEQLRYVAAILGVISACFSWVLAPSTDKFKFMFLIMFTSGVCALVQFGKDLYHLNRATELPQCNQINDNMTNKYICIFTRYRATCIFDIFSGVVGILMSFFLLYQALTGTVSRRLVFNEQKGTWEKVILSPDQHYSKAFPLRFARQRPFFNICVFLVACINGTLLALSVTQSTGDLLQFVGEATPRYNPYRTTPVDQYIIQGDEAIRYGSWPKLNFELRLSANAAAIVILAFLIQWRRDGRFAQLFVLLGLFADAVVYLAAFSLDYIEYRSAHEDGCNYAKANAQECSYQRYQAIVIFDGFCGFLLLIFSSFNLLQYLKQAQKPHEVIEDRDYGWWCFGEWAAKAEAKKHAKKTADLE